MELTEVSKHLKELSSRLGIKNMAPSDVCPNIELTTEEAETALAAARQLKSYQLEQETKRKASEAREAEIRREWQPEELFQYICDRAKYDFKIDLIVDETNSHVIKALTYYFTNHPEFENMGPWSLNKGLMLQGNVGLGKSLLMQLFSLNKRQCFDMMSCRKIAALYAKDGHDILYSFSEVRKEAYGDPRVFYQRQIGICFDDLGTEETKKHFGNQVNVMAEIILNRYDKKQETGGHFTHITTNLTADEIEECYGTRVRSRLREMFNAIKLEGKDRRK